MAIVEYDEYKGHKLIVLKMDENDQRGFKFGKSKAKLVVENIDKVKKFAEDEDEESKGRKIVLKRDENDQYAFEFDQSKAKLIVDNFEAVKKFSEEE